MAKHKYVCYTLGSIVRSERVVSMVIQRKAIISRFNVRSSDNGRGGTAKNFGFTIVEMLIVMAIAGFILLLVFLLVAQAQRHARNFGYKHGLQAIFAQLTTYPNDHSGLYPILTSNSSSAVAAGEWGDFYTNYVTGGVYDSTAGDYNYRDTLTGQHLFPSPYQYDLDYCGVASGTCSPCNSECINASGYNEAGNGINLLPGQATIIMGAKCNGNTPVSADGRTDGDYQTGQFAMLVGLEPNGYYCISS
jgi:prepilin-type N-terminal cleavage/methylation domain-containing protein